METITFNPSGDKYKAEFVSNGKQVVQIEREHKGSLTLTKRIGDMAEIRFAEYDDKTSANIMMEVYAPAGTTVAIVSDSKVIGSRLVEISETGGGGGSDDYLTKNDAQATYLSKVNAQSTYLSKTDATSTYATKTELGNINTALDAINGEEV